MSYATTDLSDAHPQAQVCDPVFRDFGGRSAFHGPIQTLKIFEDNALVRATLETPGEGRVLVVDGGGSLRCALVGGNLGVLAVRNQWAGIVVNGCVRDLAELGAQALGIKALAAHPRKSEKGLHCRRALCPRCLAVRRRRRHPGRGVRPARLRLRASCCIAT
jgi:regulator of ribonuclease activity A